MQGGGITRVQCPTNRTYGASHDGFILTGWCELRHANPPPRSQAPRGHHGHHRPADRCPPVVPRSCHRGRAAAPIHIPLADVAISMMVLDLVVLSHHGDDLLVANWCGA